jgi:hypothetical protein
MRRSAASFADSLRECAHRDHGCACDLEPLEPRQLLAANPPLPVAAFVAAAGDRVSLADVADMDNDGNNDLVFVTEQKLVVRHGNGDGTFTPGSQRKLPFVPDQVEWARPLRLVVNDFDGDGDNDAIVVATLKGLMGQVHSRTWWFTNDGDGNLAFTSKLNSVDPIYNKGVRAEIDVDGDGSVELVVGTQGRVIHVGDGTIREMGRIGPGVVDPQYVDFDEDGDLDAVGSGLTGGLGTDTSGAVMLWRNDGFNANGRLIGSTFPLALLPDAPEGPMLVTGVRWADINDDGLKDLVAGGATREVANVETPAGRIGVYVFVNQGDGSFLPAQTIYEETFAAIRARGGHGPNLPSGGTFYSYGASVSNLQVDSDAAPSIQFVINSTQSWNYRPTSAETFSERFAIHLSPTSAGPQGVPVYVASGLFEPYAQPERDAYLAKGDLDNDGEDDLVLGRANTASDDGGRMVYVELSSRPESRPRLVKTFKNNVERAAPTLAIGDRYRIRFDVNNPAAPIGGGSTMPTTGRVYIDSNGNGRLDAADVQISMATATPGDPTPGAPASNFSTFVFYSKRTAAWGEAGQRFVFIVVDRPDGSAGVPETRSVTLI